MPLPDDATLFIPYTVIQTALRDQPWVAVQTDANDNILYMSAVSWSTEAEAIQHAHDLNWLREKALESMTTTNLWVSVDIVSDGPDALVIFEKLLNTDNRIAGWRLLNPAADEDNDAWESARERVQNTIDALAQEELPEDDETLQEHLITRHSYSVEETERNDDTFDAMEWAKHHRTELHGASADWDHTHEWNDEEVTDGGDEEEGAHEDTDS